MMFCIILAAISAVNLAQAVSFGFDPSINIGLARALQRRQGIPNVPQECKSTCDPITFDISAGCTPSACCTNQFEMGYFDCFSCVANSINLTDFSVPQQTVDQLVVLCSQSGIAIPKLTFPGQDPNRSLSTIPVGSQTATSPSSGGSSATNTHPTITPVSLTSTPGPSTISQATTVPQSSLLFTQSTVSVLTPTSSASNPAQGGSQINGSNSYSYNPVLVTFSALLIGYSILLA